MQRLRFVTLRYANYGKCFREIHQNHEKSDALLMHYWCTFESASKVYQNPKKVHQKCIILMHFQKCIKSASCFLKILMIFFKKKPWLQCKIFIFNALSSKFDLSFEDVLLKFPWNWFNICCIFIALSLHFWKCKPSAIVFVGAFIDCTLIAFQKCNQSVMDFGKFSHCMSPTKFHWRAAH